MILICDTEQEAKELDDAIEALHKGEKFVTCLGNFQVGKLVYVNDDAIHIASHAYPMSMSGS